MLRKVLVVVGFVILGHLLLTQSVEARYDYELGYYCNRDVECRDAADADDWIERGRALVTDSPVFRDGIRLTAGAVEEGGEFEPGLASAIYRFSVPGWAPYLKIKVRYNDASKDNKVAGRLWIKSTDKDAKREIESEEEVPFYGDTFVLRSDQTSETVYVPSARHLEDSRLEMHIVAEGRDCLDVKYIRVEYLEKKPARIRVVHRVYDDYWHMWPPFWYVYHYYYWGPYFWPRAYLVYEWWRWPCDYYWTVWRPWFRLHVRAHCFYPWWGPRRYTVVYHCDPGHPPARKKALFRRRLKERHVWVGKILRPRVAVRKPIRAPSQIRGVRTQETRLKKQIKSSKRLAGRPGFDPIQRQLAERSTRVQKRPEKRVVKPHTSGQKYHESRRLLRSKSRSVSPSYNSTNQIRRENQKQIQSRTTPRISRPKPVVRESSRIRSTRTQEARTKTQIRGSSRLNGKVDRDPARRRLKERPVRVEKRQEKVLANRQTVVRKHGESQHSVRSNPQSVKSSSVAIANKQIRKESQERLRSRTAPRISRPKSVVRERSRIRSTRTPEPRPKKQIWGKSEIRGKSWSGNHVAKRTFPARSGTRAFGRPRR